MSEHPDTDIARVLHSQLRLAGIEEVKAYRCRLCLQVWPIGEDEDHIVSCWAQQDLENRSQQYVQLRDR